MKLFLKLIFVLFIIVQIQAQEKTISGVVSDENGLPLPSATVLVKGTSNGIQTDFDGNYSITAQVGDIIVFAYVGYNTREVTVGASNEINVSMELDNTLDEVVVMAYRAETKTSVKAYTPGIKVRGMSSSSNQPAYGQLTAGEINDLEKWEDWLKAINKKEFKSMQKKWNFQLENKIEVIVNDENNNPLTNIKVVLFDENNNQLMSARTDRTGKAYLFKDLNNICNDNYFIIQVEQNNKIEGKKITTTYDRVIFNLNNQKESNDIDIMFTIDATGSMGDEINYLKSELKNIIERLDESINEKRVALTFYRDRGDDYVVKDFDFNSNIDEVKDTLYNQNADGGGDYEEAVDEALKVSMQKSWNKNAKTKLMFLLLDAPPHLTKENVETIKNQIKIAQEKGIKIIPIVASDANKDVEFLMRFFSVATNGTYVFLTNDSGIGNDHIKPTTDDFKVEKLNDLIVRLIEKYSGVVS